MLIFDGTLRPRRSQVTFYVDQDPTDTVPKNVDAAPPVPNAVSRWAAKLAGAFH